ncbi:hypothetical protein [Isobaculum melis]|uniref:Peptidase propeptide and YPEB domain-containing protein n=1 Tax=Isobaculum melis TaxID=142588 RepID=A0A1H9TEP4_9LACT|nr:hypothetical protein [Isobaculum melis]SER95083.1 hypothetical protein SAMN04488559_11257 [Isobaculum melis]
MKKLNRLLPLFMLSLLLLGGCATSNEKNKTDQEQASENNKSVTDAQENQASSEEITSQQLDFTAEQAIEYLSAELNHSPDLTYGVIGLNPDGQSYQIRVIVKSYVENGGTGTAGLYDVYSDQHVELHH